MRKKQVKGKAGNAAQYITRNQALKKLQLKLSEFRRLCILKGIHPREPRKKPAGRHKTYYHVKDILFLAHEPLLNKFRADAAFERRVRKARAKKGDGAARALEAERPVHRLDHLVRERYPTFGDALRDLDDPLSLVHLFAALPSDAKAGVPAAAVAASRAVATEWAAWCARSRSLRRAFISVKGYYFQASVRGHSVTWLAPHALAQVLPHDVDFRVMATFLELACTTLRHVLARLFADLGSPYPPRADAALDGAAAGLEALMRGLAAAAAVAGNGGGGAGAVEGGASAPATPLLLGGSLSGKRERRRARRAAERAAAGGGAAAAADNGEGDGGDSSGDDDDGEGADAARAARLAALPAKAAALAVEAGDGPASSSQRQAEEPPAASSDAAACATLFRGLVFYIAREVPREPLLLLLRSFGADAVTWEGPGAPLKVDDPRITHAIVDRPPSTAEASSAAAAAAAPALLPPRASVVPQWAFDSANFRVRADERRYAPGKRPPPHLSPFADAADDGGYVPAYAEELRALREASARRAAKGAGGTAAADALAEFEAAAAAVAERGGGGGAGGGGAGGGGAGAAGGDGEEEEAPDAIDADEAAAAAAHAEGLARELGLSVPKKSKASSAAAASADDAAVEPSAEVAKAADADRMRAAMLPRKKRHLYESVRKAQDAKKARGEKLAEKAAAANAAAGAGK